MNLKNLGSNMTALENIKGMIVLFSYATPVALIGSNGPQVTDKFWSRTTTKHINKFFSLYGVGANSKTAAPISQSELDNLVKEVA